MSTKQEDRAPGMMDEFRKYIYQYRCEKGQPYTHTSIGSPKISLHIPEDRVDEFIAAYTRAMVKGSPLHMTEKPTDPSPMRSDLDFRFPMGEDKVIRRVYQREHVERIVLAYFQVLEGYVHTTPAERIAYVMEKPDAVEYRDKIKDGLHIVWPHLILSHTLQNLIRKRMLDMAPMLFAGLPVCNTYEDIIDRAIIDKNNWQMYGSSKPDLPAYRVTHIYRYEPGQGDEEADDGSVGKLVALDAPTAEEELRMVKLMSMRHRGPATEVREDKLEEVEEYMRHVLPTMDERRKNKLHNDVFGRSMNRTKNFVSEDELVLARQLVSECLDQTRAESYEKWIKLGWVLRNIDYRLLEVWVEFSKFSSKYVEGECQKFWDVMRMDTLGIGTLKWWAKNDNPQKYQEILNNNVNELVNKCIASDGAHTDVAHVVHEMYKDDYRFTVKDTWYVYDRHRHRWVRSREGLRLRLVLSGEVCSKFMERAMFWSGEACKFNTETRDLYETKAKTLTAISLRLKQSGYKDSVMKECRALFTDERFEELLDSHPHLLGFENGVYDLRMHEFRDGSPDDYISFSTKRHYVPHNPEAEEVKEIEKYLSQVFTNEAVRKYMMDIMAVILDGGIRREEFYILTGSGCHAKDTEVRMFDGSLKKIQDVEVGELLMGDDSTPRTVQELFRGEDDMYRITPTKGEPFVVNKDHVLSVKFTNTVSIIQRKDCATPRWRVIWFQHNGDLAPIKKSKTIMKREDAEKFRDEEIPKMPNVIRGGDVKDIKVCDLLQWDKWWWERGNVNLYRPAEICYDQEGREPMTMDPYMLGYWLGDGTHYAPSITTADKEVVEYFESNLPAGHKMVVWDDKGAAKTYGIRADSGRRKNVNHFTANLRKYNVLRNKHIPLEYMTASREDRLQLLAGLLDSDGDYQDHCMQFSISQKREALLDQIIDLARSLGFASYKKEFMAKCNGKLCGPYFRAHICGPTIGEIPVKILRKECNRERKKVKDITTVSFQMEPIGRGDYFGFELDHNHRYLTGDGLVHHNSNSKSKLLELIQKCVGEYYCILPIALLTQKRAASNSAQAELERTKGRRWAVMQEPGESERLNIGLMKELSGGDIIQCRGLFKEPIEFKPQFKMLMTCNELPEVPSDDGGTWRRIRVIEFTSKFCEHPDPNDPRQFPLDIELADKMERWSDHFISMLLAHHKKVDPKHIKEPMEVKIATEGYKKNNDAIGQFVEEKLVRDEDSTERVPLAKLYLDFKAWALQNMQRGKKIPERPQFKAYMEKTFGAYPSDNKGWRGVRYMRNGAEGEDGAGSDVE